MTKSLGAGYGSVMWKAEIKLSSSSSLSDVPVQLLE